MFQRISGWWILATLFLIPQILRILLPGLAEIAWFVNMQLFALGALIAVAVTVSVIKQSLYGVAQSDYFLTSENNRRQKVIGYSRFYKSQKIVAMGLTIILWSIFAIMAFFGELDSRLFFILLPVSLVFPVWQLSDKIKEKKLNAKV